MSASVGFANGEYGATTAMLETIHAAGITHVFCAWGSDHASILECIARAKAGAGRKGQLPLPEFISVTHEFVAMSAAQGYYQATGRMAGVILHVDVGLQNAGGAVHNAHRARIPVLVFTGMSAVTLEGEARGSRTEFINQIQDSFDMPGIVRGYSKYSYEIRHPSNIRQVVMRAVQIAMSHPRGPVHLFAAREVLEEPLPVPAEALNIAHWRPVAPQGLTEEQALDVAELLCKARNPLVLTSWLGDDWQASLALISLCEQLSIPLVDASPFSLNMPATHPLHMGSHWSGGGQNKFLAEADVVLVVDSNVPYIQSQNKPSLNAVLIHLDSDPLKQFMPLFYVAAEHRYQVQSGLALRQIAKAATGRIDKGIVQERAERLRPMSIANQQRLIATRPSTGDGPQSAAVGLAVLGSVLPKDVFVVSEAISNFPAVLDQLGLSEAQRYASNGASSLGYGGGAAVAAKLAMQSHPDSKPGLGKDTLVCYIAGDGSYLFSIPTSVQHLATRLRAPTMTVILNNSGWASPGYSARLVHPEGYASKASGAQLGIDFGPEEDQPDYVGMAIASAGGPHRAWGARVVCGAEEMKSVFEQAIAETLGGKSTTVELVLPAI